MLLNGGYNRPEMQQCWQPLEHNFGWIIAVASSTSQKLYTADTRYVQLHTSCDAVRRSDLT